MTASEIPAVSGPPGLAQRPIGAARQSGRPDGERTMRTLKCAGQGLAVLALLAIAVTSLAAPAPDDSAALKKRALELNRVTGADPTKGKILEMLEDAAGSKKLLVVA